MNRGKWSVLADGVLLEQDGDEGGGGNGDESADDTCQGCAQEQSDQHGEAHEIDAGTHDARGEEDVFYVGVDEIEDENAGHLGPGVERRYARGQDDGDDAAGNGNDIEEAHEK